MKFQCILSIIDAQRTGSESPGSRTASESSESDSEPGEEKVEFITSFGGDEEQETVKRWEEEVEEKRRLKRAHYEKPIGPRPPSPPGERRKRSRGRSGSRNRSQDNESVGTWSVHPVIEQW